MSCVLEESADPAGDGRMSPWYAIYVRSNFEHTVHRHLEQKGYDLFLPTCRMERRWSDRVKQIHVPLFPGYVFCRLDQKSWLPILTTPGVIRLVGNGKNPLPITEGEISSVQAVINSNLPFTPWPFVEPGSRIVVDRGPLMGVHGVLLESRTGNRLVVSIDILSRAIAIEIDAAWVDASLSRPQLSSLDQKARVT